MGSHTVRFYGLQRHTNDFDLTLAPDGRNYGLTDEALLNETATRHGDDLELMHLRHGIFDEADVSVVTLGTIRSIARGGPQR